MIMTDIHKNPNDICKLTTISSSVSQKYEGDKDLQNCSFSNFDLANQKQSHNSITLGISEDLNKISEGKTGEMAQIIDQESEESQNSQKLKDKPTTDLSTKNNKLSEIEVVSVSGGALEQDCVSKQFSASESEMKYSILNSKILNPKCSKCQATLLGQKAVKPVSKWVQCLECFQILHNPCEIQLSVNELKVPVCIECNLKKKPLLVNSTISVKKPVKPKLLKPSKKSQMKSMKLFRDRRESFMYLDSFLNSFSYKLAITEEQIKKEIKTTGRKIESLRAYEKTSRY